MDFDLWSAIAGGGNLAGYGIIYLIIKQRELAIRHTEHDRRISAVENDIGSKIDRVHARLDKINHAP